jgi:hypothetical protein
LKVGGIKVYDLDNENVKNIKFDFIKVLRVWHSEYKILDNWLYKNSLNKKIPPEVFYAVEHYKDNIIHEKIWKIEEMMMICQVTPE